MLKDLKVFREIEHNGKMIKIQFHTKKPNSKEYKKISKHKTCKKAEYVYSHMNIKYKINLDRFSSECF